MQCDSILCAVGASQPARAGGAAKGREGAHAREALLEREQLVLQPVRHAAASRQPWHPLAASGFSRQPERRERHQPEASEPSATVALETFS